MKAIRFVGKAVLWLAIIVSLAVALAPPLLDQPYYFGPNSGRYDGERFFNPGPDDTSAPPSGRSRSSFFSAMIFGSEERQVWPESVPVTPSKPAPRTEGNRMVATWIGHATVLIQTSGLNILTDPIYSERAGPFGFGPERVTVPGVAFDDLPKIDFVVVSHNHYDHMDTATLKRLWDRDRPYFITPLGNDTLLRRAGIPIAGLHGAPGIVALDWNAATMIEGKHMKSWRQNAVGAAPVAEVTVTRNHHWSSRWFADRNRALWSSFFIRTPGGNILFSGDTGFGDGNWPVEAGRLGPVRLALIPIGAFRFREGQMDTASHIGPHQAVEVFKAMGASFAIPIHWGTFQLSYEARETPPRMLAEVLKCHAIPNTQFAARRVGEPVEVPPFANWAPLPPVDEACLKGPAITRLR